MGRSDLYYLAGDRLSVTGSEPFADATADELRVLLALIELAGDEPSAEKIAGRSGVSKARCLSALTLWCESGVVCHGAVTADPRESAMIIEEFPTRLGDMIEEDAKSVAKTIRDEHLADLFRELALKMKKTELSEEEIKRVTKIYTQLKVSEEYILTLAEWMNASGKLSVKRLVDEAMKLVNAEIDNVTELKWELERRDKEGLLVWEFRKTLGIYNRALSATERKYLARWSSDLGFEMDVIGEAYDIAVVNTGKLSLSYMDKLLTDWAAAGAKTVEEARTAYEKNSAALSEQYKTKTAAKPKKNRRDEGVLSNYDSDSILQSVLARSFAEPDEDETKGD